MVLAAFTVGRSGPHLRSGGGEPDVDLERADAGAMHQASAADVLGVPGLWGGQ